MMRIVSVFTGQRNRSGHDIDKGLQYFPPTHFNPTAITNNIKASHSFMSRNYVACTMDTAHDQTNVIQCQQMSQSVLVP